MGAGPAGGGLLLGVPRCQAILDSCQMRLGVPVGPTPRLAAASYPAVSLASSPLLPAKIGPLSPPQPPCLCFTPVLALVPGPVSAPAPCKPLPCGGPQPWPQPCPDSLQELELLLPEGVQKVLCGIPLGIGGA